MSERVGRTLALNITCGELLSESGNHFGDVRWWVSPWSISESTSTMDLSISSQTSSTSRPLLCYAATSLNGYKSFRKSDSFEDSSWRRSVHQSDILLSSQVFHEFSRYLRAKCCTMATESANQSKGYYPLAGLARDGWSTDEDATATCFCGAVQLSFVSDSCTALLWIRQASHNVQYNS